MSKRASNRARTLRTTFAIIVIAAVAAACAWRPIGPKVPSGLLAALNLDAILSTTGVFVPPIVGMPAEISEDLRQRLAESLRARDVPASTTRSIRGGHLLEGAATVAVAEEGERVIVVNWRLLAPDGLTVASFNAREPLGETGGPVPVLVWTPFGRLGDIVEDTWAGVPEADVVAIAERTAKWTARYMTTPGAPAADLPAVAIRPPLDAPGDAEESLPEALSRQLNLVGIDVVERQDRDTFLVTSFVRIVPVDNLSDGVYIEWQLIDPEGMQVGVIRQQNLVPKGRLNAPWGEVARFAAEGAREGIQELLGQAVRAKRAGSPLG